MVSPRLRALLSEAVAPVLTEICELRDRTAETLRVEFTEIHRMLRQQGDASDEVAEILGRTLARLGAEVEALSEAVDRLESGRSTAGPQPADSSP
jgi:predicted RecB family endonuclease